MIAVGVRVRTNIDLQAEDETTIPRGTLGVVIGFEGEQVIVSLSGDRTLICEAWEIRTEGAR